jgi:hypothetical protein
MTSRVRMKELNEKVMLQNVRMPTTASVLANAEANPSSFLGMIIKQLGSSTAKMLDSIKQDTGKGANTSRVLAELFMWNWIMKYAEKRYDTLMALAKEEKVIDDLEELGTGNHTVAESRHFVVTANVTEPVKRFNPDALCQWAFESHKIPIIVMKEQIEKAKLPTKSSVRVTVTERA